MPKPIHSIAEQLARLAIANFYLSDDNPYALGSLPLKMWDHKAILSYEFYDELINYHPIGKNPFLSRKHIFEMAVSILLIVDVVVTGRVEEMQSEELDVLISQAKTREHSKFDQLAFVVERIKESAVQNLDFIYDRLRGLIERCESPLEIAFLVGFLSGTASAGYIRNMEAQYPIDTYRVDFAIVDRKLVLEVDGHSFHEKTPQQAARDRERDRNLYQKGWTVLRFHRLEIEQSLDKCIEQVYGILKAGD
jgi:hypothetical protein